MNNKEERNRRSDILSFLDNKSRESKKYLNTASVNGRRKLIVVTFTRNKLNPLTMPKRHVDDENVSHDSLS